MVRKKLSRIATLAALGALIAFPAGAQRAVFQQVTLRAPYDGEFRSQFAGAAGLVNATELARLQLLDALRRSDIAPERRDAQFGAYLATDLFVRPPRFAPAGGSAGEPFRQLVPEAQALIDWTHAFRRQVYDLLSDPDASMAEKDGRMVELLGYYRSRPSLALSTRPKDVGSLNLQPEALAFRASHPRVNGQLWAIDWLELALLESLVAPASDRAGLIARASTRFRQMLDGAPDAAPYLMPVSSAVAPVLAMRYPDVAATLDNLHLLQDYLADLMVAPEIPRSAHRREILRALAFFRADSASTSLDAWFASAEAQGVRNMGGATIGFREIPEPPTVARGAAVKPATLAMPAMAGMDHSAMAMPAAQGAQGAPDWKAAVDRMMADPVIRERAATDPVLQALLAGRATAAAMPGMDHGNMQSSSSAGSMAGMTMAGPATTAPATSDAERRSRDEFLLRLLADPTVESRIHADSQLHRLWSDPDVQRRLAELRQARGVSPSTTPSAPRPIPPLR